MGLETLQKKIVEKRHLNYADIAQRVYSFKVFIHFLLLPNKLLAIQTT